MGVYIFILDLSGLHVSLHDNLKPVTVIQVGDYIINGGLVTKIENTKYSTLMTLQRQGCIPGNMHYPIGSQFLSVVVL